MTNIEIVRKLIGPISPTGRSEVDSERLENLKTLCNLVEGLIMDIDDVHYNNKHSKEHSVKEISDFASKFITERCGIV